MLAVTAPNMIHSEVPIFNDPSKHFDWYLANDVFDVGFQFIYRSRLGYVDFGLNVAPKTKIQEV